MKIVFKRAALKQLKNYKKKDPLAYKLIKSKLLEISDNPFDVRYEVVVSYPSYKRARKGRYRICFKVVDDYIYVGRIDDRSKVYH